MSGGPFLCYRQLTPTTGVLFAKFFFCEDAEYLITGTINTLNVYLVSRSDLDSDPDASLLLVQTFQLFGRINDIKCMGSCSADQTKKQVILVCLDEGKIIVLQFCPKLNDLNIVHLYNGEEGAIGEGAELHATSKGKRKPAGLYGHCPVTAVDTAHMLGCSVLYGDQFFFVSIRDPLSAAMKKSEANAFIFDISTYFPFPQIYDICFVPGFGKPVIAVLLSAENVPIGHTKHRASLASVILFAVDVITSTVSKLWSKSALPNDSHQLIPLKNDRLPGSVLVVGMNSCIMLSSRGTCGLASNGLAGITVSSSIPLRPANVPGYAYGIELVDSKWMQVDENTLIFSLRDGNLLSISLARFNENNSGAASNFEVKLIASSVVGSCLACSTHGDVWFIGSANGDSILLSVESSKDICIVDNKTFGTSVAASSSTFGTPALKRRRVSRGATPSLHSTPKLISNGTLTSSMSPQEVSQLIEAEESLLYGTSLKNIGLLESFVSHSTFSLRVTDVVVGMGPILDGLCGSHDDSVFTTPKLHWSEGHDHKVETVHKLNSAAAYIADREMRDGLQVSAGTGGDGSVCRIYSGYRLNKIATREFGDCISVNSLSVDGSFLSSLLPEHSGLAAGAEAVRRAIYSLFFLSTKSGGTKFLISSGSNIHGDASKKSQKGKPKDAHHHSTAGVASATFAELAAEDVGFVGEHPTLRVGTLHHGRIGIQVTGIGVRVTEFAGFVSPVPLQDMLIAEEIDLGGMGGIPGEIIIQADISDDIHENSTRDNNLDGFVIVLSSIGNVYVLKYDTEDSNLVLVRSTTFGNDNDGQEVLLAAGSYTCASIFSGCMPDVLFDGDEEPPCEEVSKAPSTTVNDIISMEEAYLYGSTLAEESGMSQTDVKKSQSADDNYLLLCDQSSRVHCFQLSTMKYLFCSDCLGVGRRNVKLSRAPVFQMIPKTDRVNKVIDMCLSVVGRDMSTESGEKPSSLLDRLTIVACLDSAEVVVYTANSHTMNLSSFVKVSHSVISRRPKRRLKLQRDFGGAENRTINSASQSSTENPLDDPRMYNIRRFMGIDGRKGVICNGLRPIIVINDTGLPTAAPISLPELPFSSVGYYCFSPASYAGGSYRGFCSLWVEVKSRMGSDMAPPLPPSLPPGSAMGHGFQPPLPPQPKPPAFTLASVLGFYRGVHGLKFLPNSNLSMKKSRVGHSVHRIQEILPRTDDKIQLALLKRRTFLLSASLEVESEFKEDVLSDTEAAEDKAHYDRYFPCLTSFGQNSSDLGPPPSEKRDQHCILLVQNNDVVDEYKLPPYESVLGLETLYFEVPVSKPGDPPNAPQFNKSIVFVAACTSIDDRHGNDTQAEGRVLFFAVDYALYEGANSTDKPSDVELTPLEAGGAISAGIDTSIPISTPGTVPNGSGGVTPVLSNTQSTFLDSISPKLRLCWTGPGPSTIIKQLGKRYVIATLGSVLYIYNYNMETSELDQLSFYFAPFFITSVNVLKNFVIIGDSVQGLQFLQWNEENSELSLLGKDYETVLSLNSSFVLDGNKLGMVTADFEGNIQLLQYNPRVVESRKGFKLLCMADFYLGSTVSMFLPHRLLNRALPGREMIPSLRGRQGIYNTNKFGHVESASGLRYEKTSSFKTSVFTGTIYGEFGIVVPIDEGMYRRLMLLQQIMGSVMKTTCALNPREYRFIKTSEMKLERKRGLVDGSLLWKFMDLDSRTQDELCAAMGTSVDVVFENLLEIDFSWGFF